MIFPAVEQGVVSGRTIASSWAGCRDSVTLGGSRREKCASSRPDGPETFPDLGFSTVTSNPEAHPSISIETLESVLQRAPAAGDWMAQTAERLATLTPVTLRVAYARVPRQLGPAANPVESREPTRHWSLVDWARAWLVVRALERFPASEWTRVLEQLFEGGELGEQVSLLRAVGALPEPSRFVELAVSACRTNATAVFEAIACQNPYPALYFPEPSFNQMVMKAVFMDLPLARIVGLARRNNPELARMARDFAAERRAAGRPVPADLALLDPSFTPTGAAS